MRIFMFLWSLLMLATAVKGVTDAFRKSKYDRAIAVIVGAGLMFYSCTVLVHVMGW